MKALLIDVSRCIGCRACQIACKQWNQLPPENTRFFSGKGYQNPRDLTSKTWKLVTYNELKHRGRYEWVFGNKQCFHCLDPGCASACPVHALKKTEAGPVTYDADICLGCRYCQMACPFQVPKFEWDKALPQISKCTFCADRVQNGLETACAKACPTKAIVFGEREEMLKEAHRRIQYYPQDYVHHVYGEHEVGGTCVLVISDVEFGNLGYKTEVPNSAVGNFTKPAMGAIPFVLTGLGVTLGAFAWVVNRRNELREKGGEDA